MTDTKELEQSVTEILDMLEKFFVDLEGKAYKTNEKLNYYEARQAILAYISKHYISKEAVERAIGEYDCNDPDTMTEEDWRHYAKYQCNSEYDVDIALDDLRQQIRKELGL